MTFIGDITWADTTTTGYIVCVLIGPDTYRTAERRDGEWTWTSATMTHSESVEWYTRRTTPEPVDDADVPVLDRLLEDLHGVPAPSRLRSRDELLADRTRWTLADIARAIGRAPDTVVRLALAAQTPDPNPLSALPPPLPGTGTADIFKLLQAARGQIRGPEWIAGEVRRWALQTARIDHNLHPIIAKPPRRARPQSRVPRPATRPETGRADG